MIEYRKDVEWPKISIVTPSYDQGEFLEQTIQSVLKQKYPNLEYIVIDGGSTDSSIEIIKRYEKYISYWVSEKDHGQTDALNKGFRNATGEIFGFLNSDDWYADGALKAVAEQYIKHHGRHNLLITGAVNSVGIYTLDAVHHNQEFGTIEQWYFGGVSLHQPGCFWTADVYEKYGPFREDMHYCFDRFFFSTLCANGTEFLHVDQVLSFFRHHQDSKTESANRLFKTEWESKRSSLLKGIPLSQQFRINFQGWKNENWLAVNVALKHKKSCLASIHTIGQRLIKSPVALFHRPVLSAIAKIALKCLLSRQ